MRIVLGLPVMGFSSRVINLGIRKRGLEFLLRLSCCHLIREINTVFRYQSVNFMKLPQKEPGYAVVLEITLLGC